LLHQAGVLIYHIEGVYTFFVPRLCSTLAWWWLFYSRNMLPRS